MAGYLKALRKGSCETAATKTRGKSGLERKAKAHTGSKEA
jgi:hypothetical protein